MKHFLLIIFTLVLALPLSAQTQRKSNVSSKKTQTTTKRKTTTKSNATKKTTVDKKTRLRNERAATEMARKQSQARLAKLNSDVKTSLDSVLVLDHEIGRQKKSIDSLNNDINALEHTIDTLSTQIGKLQKELTVKKHRYAKAMVYMRKNRSLQNRLMFIFSADNFMQMIRRMRYMREYSRFQKAQGEMLKEKQLEVKAKQNELLAAKAQKEQNRLTVERHKQSLQMMKDNCQSQVAFLNKNISAVRIQIKEYQKKERSLNAEIDRIIQAEIEAQRRAEAERKRREAEARAKAEAEARAKAKRLAEAKAAAEKARKAAEAAELARKNAKTAEERSKAKAEAEKAKHNLRNAEADVKTATKEEKAERRKAETWRANDSANTRLSSNFASNKGRLPVPITGSYNIVGHYGRYTVAGLSNVTLNNRGVDIRGQQGCCARSVFEGTVSSVFQYGGSYTVMLRHGSYISVYSGLSSVNVSKGQSVGIRANLGSIGANSDGRYVLHFQLRNSNGNQSLNPEQWIK